MTSPLFQCSSELSSTLVPREISCGPATGYRKIENVRDSLRVRIILKGADRAETQRRVRQASERLRLLKEATPGLRRSVSRRSGDFDDDRCTTPDPLDF